METRPQDRGPFRRPDSLRHAAPGDALALCVAAASFGARIDFTELFGNDRPIELDIGCGKGLFLLREALRRPEVNFVGFEWAKTYAATAAGRLHKHGVVNARLVVGDVRPLLPRIPEARVAAVHVYFPDPWWKRRHRKRRLFNSDFVQQVGRLLVPAGRLHLATDVEEYFGAMLAVLARAPALVRLEDPQPAAAEHDLDYLTHFERKYRKEGRDIFRAAFARKGTDARPPTAPVLPAVTPPP